MTDIGTLASGWTSTGFHGFKYNKLCLCRGVVTNSNVTGVSMNTFVTLNNSYKPILIANSIGAGLGVPYQTGGAPFVIHFSTNIVQLKPFSQQDAGTNFSICLLWFVN